MTRSRARRGRSLARDHALGLRGVLDKRNVCAHSCASLVECRAEVACLPALSSSLAVAVPALAALRAAEATMRIHALDERKREDSRSGPGKPGCCDDLSAGLLLDCNRR
jgi:hypothetical protein